MQIIASDFLHFVLFLDFFGTFQHLDEFSTQHKERTYKI